MLVEVDWAEKARKYEADITRVIEDCNREQTLYWRRHQLEFDQVCARRDTLADKLKDESCSDKDRAEWSAANSRLSEMISNAPINTLDSSLEALRGKHNQIIYMVPQ